MKRLLTILLLLAVLPAVAQQYNYGQDQYVKIWDDKDAPHSNGLTEKGIKEVKADNDFVFNTTSTELYIYKADPANRSRKDHPQRCCGQGSGQGRRHRRDELFTRDIDRIEGVRN